MSSRARRAGCGFVVAGGLALLRPGTKANKLTHRELEKAKKHLRYMRGRLQGAKYRMQGGRPDPDVIDNVLADRVRSELGPVEKRLDLPHIHVMVEDRVALLHGEVGTDADAEELERAVSAVPGVVGVESYLHIGLIVGDTRPSAGRAVHPPSDAMRRLLAAARQASIAETATRPVVRAVLANFAERLPTNERVHVAGHLPEDVRRMFTPPRRLRKHGPIRTTNELIARIAADIGELPQGSAYGLTAAVIEAFRALVPEEAADIDAVLPEDLKKLWRPQSAGVWN